MRQPLLKNFNPQRARVDWPPPTATVEAAIAKERHSLELVLTATYPKAATYFLAKGCTRDEASDLASETLVRVAENLHTLRNPGAYRTWVWQLAGSVFRDWVRSKEKMKHLRNHTPTSTSSGPQENFETTEEERRVQRAFMSLTTEEQEILWLRYVEELPYSEIAQAHSKSENAARVAAHRARKRLARIFDNTK